MKIIIGLGNPGKQYENTRHNVGFDILDKLQKYWSFPNFSAHDKFRADISEGSIRGNKIILVKPFTFMNLSGTSVRAIVDFYKLSPKDIIVVQDELDLPLGKYRIATDSSAAGHNGVKNIINHLGTQTFVRLRIGIATEKQSASCLRNAHDFVLDRFSQNELNVLNEQFPIHEKEILAFLAI